MVNIRGGKFLGWQKSQSQKLIPPFLQQSEQFFLSREQFRYPCMVTHHWHSEDQTPFRFKVPYGGYF